jgi:hypothetical protein
VKSAAAPAQLGEVEYLSEAPRAAVVLTLEVVQGLPIICESDLHLTPSARAALASAFLESVSLFALSDLCLFWLLSSPGTGTRQRPRQARGKADYRDALQSLVKCPSKR